MLPHRLVPILGQFQVLLVVKSKKNGKNLENFQKKFVFEADRTAKAKSFPEIFIPLERAFVAENSNACENGKIEIYRQLEASKKNSNRLFFEKQSLLYS